MINTLGTIINPTGDESEEVDRLKKIYLEKNNALLDKIHSNYDSMYLLDDLKKINSSLGKKNSHVLFDTRQSSVIELVTSINNLDHTDDPIPKPILWISLTNMKDKARIFFYTIVCYLKEHLVKSGYKKIALLRSSSTRDAVALTFIDFTTDKIRHVLLHSNGVNCPSECKRAPGSNGVNCPSERQRAPGSNGALGSSSNPVLLPGLTDLGIFYNEIPFVPDDFLRKYIEENVFKEGYVLINKIDLNFALFTLNSYELNYKRTEQFIYEASLAYENLNRIRGTINFDQQIIYGVKNLIKFKRETETEYSTITQDDESGGRNENPVPNLYELLPS